MRGLLSFILLLTAVFFVVGEFFGGWYLGLPPHTPVLVYKKTHTAELSRRTTTAQQFAFGVEGSLSRGTVMIEASFEQLASFQTGQAGRPERVVFRAEFGAGQRITVNETLRQGQGVYRIILIFNDATGTLRLTLPPAGTL